MASPESVPSQVAPRIDLQLPLGADGTAQGVGVGVSMALDTGMECVVATGSALLRALGRPSSPCTQKPHLRISVCLSVAIGGC